MVSLEKLKNAYLYFSDVYSMMNVLHDYCDLSKKRLDAIKADHIARTKALETHILGLTGLTWQTLVQPYIDYENSITLNLVFCMKDVHPDKTVRSNVAEFKRDSMSIPCLFDNKKICTIFKQYATTQYPVDKLARTEEQIRYFDSHLNVNHVALARSEHDIHRCEALTLEIHDTIQKINKHYAAYVNVVSGDVVPHKKSWDTDGNCTCRKCRKARYHARKDHESAILPLIERIAFARQELAKLRGWVQHSDYELTGTMLKTTEGVNTFLDTIHILLKPYIDRDMAILRSYAKADGIDELQNYDIHRYSLQHEQTTLKTTVRDETQYFPFERTVQNMLHVVGTLLGYTFTEIRKYYLLWDPYVKLIEVKENDTLKGYVYLDLFEREGKGKYSGGWELPLVHKSSLTVPVSVVCCFLKKDTNNESSFDFPALTTLFHEFGHAMHTLSAASTINYMSSYFSETDFKETPSQFFEYWCRSPTILKRISPEIPDDMIQGLLARDKLLAGHTYGERLLHCKMDMALHSKDFKGYSYAVAYNLCDDILGSGLSDYSLYLDCTKLVCTYDVNMYSYLYSLTIALDLLSVFEGRELDPVLGKRFKDEVLSQGALRPSHDSVVAFLGREPDMTSLLKVVQ